jgi:hypothetical protein
MTEGMSLRERQGEDEGDSVDLGELWRSAAVTAGILLLAHACFPREVEMREQGRGRTVRMGR